MQRRRAVLVCTTAALAGIGGLPMRVLAAGPGYRVSLQQLQDMVDQRFPLRYPVAGLFDVTLASPRLDVLPDLDRLSSDLPLRIAGPALRRSYSGELALDFGLRYESSDRTIRAHHLRVASLRVGGLTGEAQSLLQQAAADMARQAMLEVVLHRLRPRDLALADTMGLEPGPITVTWDGLAVEFVNKRPS